MISFKLQANRQSLKQDLNVWLTAVAISIPLILLFGFLFLVIKNAFFAFWPVELKEFQLNNSRSILGQQTLKEKYFDSEKNADLFRLQIKQGNRDTFGEDFIWVNTSEIAKISQPEDALLVERLEWGDFFGFVKGIKEGENIIADEDLLRKLPILLEANQKRAKKIKSILKDEIGAINYSLEQLRRKQNKLSKEGQLPENNPIQKEMATLNEKSVTLEKQVEILKLEDKYSLLAVAMDGKQQEIKLSNINRYYFPNQLGFFSKIKLFVAKVWEFIFAEPRESNTEGGVFPAIFGTVALVLIMSIFVTPLGVLAAIYLREYAKQGRIVSLIRIAVNNLAGVPSIVFGVCGVGFFIYRLGGSLDSLFYNDALPTPTYGTGGILWASLTLALLTLPTVIVATEEGLSSIPMHLREAAYALGATKFETLRKVILPCLLPSIFTGIILSIARAAGEVAPLMLTGVVKLAPSMPFDANFPYVHLERKFMHLGFHIYDMGFQSPNVDAARPMVFATTLLLLLIVVLLNLTAMILRNKLRKRFVGLL